MTGNSRTLGWEGAPKVPVDGMCWPLDFAAKQLGMPLKDLREAVRILGLQPSGTINTRGYRSQGRIPRAYEARRLIELQEGLRALSERLQDLDRFISRSLSPRFA